MPPRLPLLRWLVPLALMASCSTPAPAVEGARVAKPDVAVAPTPTPVPVFVHPLTGVRYEGEQAWQKRPALSLKVENSRPARPQAGLGDADLVYEELAEGGITRFIAVFSSRHANVVGPVRSARNVDPEVLAPIGGLFGFSGGVPPVVEAVRRTRGLKDVGYDREPDAYYRISSREAPHNLYTSTKKLWKGSDGTAPQPLFTFRDTPAIGDPAGSASFSFAENSEETRWTLQTDGYRRYHDDAPHEIGDGEQVTAKNVIIQFVRLTDSGIVDTAGLASPETDVIGEGKAILLSGGKVVHGTWRRSAVGSPTLFLDGAGNPFMLERGPTWVELLGNTRDVRLEGQGAERPGGRR